MPKKRKPQKHGKSEVRTFKVTASRKAKKTTRRTIGQILVDGPKNKLEQEKLDRYQNKRHAFYVAHFSNFDSRQLLIKRSVVQAREALQIANSEWRHAIQTQHLSESRLLLEKIATKANQIVEEEVALKKRDGAGSNHGSIHLVGFGGQRADSCQHCGRYLTKLCYSEVFTANRVPRTDKICVKCFHSLPKDEKKLYFKYDYRRRPEPRGLGWKPEGEWGH